MEGKELKVMKGKEGWAGWIPKSEEEQLKFKKQVYVQMVLGFG